MRRHWKTLVLGMVGFTLLFWLVPRHRGPVYGGKRLSEWIAIYGTVGPHSPKEKQQAADAIRQIGTHGLPFLLKWSDYEPAAWREKLYAQLPPRLWGEAAEHVILDSDRGRRSQDATTAFHALGSIGGPAIPELSRRAHLTNSAWTSANAMSALCFIGRQSVPALKEIISDPNRAERLPLDAIIELGTNAGPLLPLLVSHLQSTNLVLAIVSATVLGRLALEPDRVVPALTESLSDPRVRVRASAATALEIFGEAARPALPALQAALTDPNRSVRALATNAFQSIVRQGFPSQPSSMNERQAQ